MSKIKEKRLKGLRRGWVATLKTKILNFGEGRHKYEVYEVTGKDIDKPRYFVDEESVRLFVNAAHTQARLAKDFNNAVKRICTKRERKEMQSAKELRELVPDLEVVVPAEIRDTQAKRPEDTDKYFFFGNIKKFSYIVKQK
jgi:hypothetical protein